MKQYKTNKIVDRMRDQGLTQELLAERLGVTQPTISRTLFEQSRSEQLRRGIADILGAAVNELWATPSRKRGRKPKARI